MRSPALFLLLGCCLGCGGLGSPTTPPGTAFNYTVADQAESRVCESPVTPQAMCTITLTAHIMLGELEGREWQVRSIQSSVRDQCSGQDLHALPATLTAEEIRQVAGTSVLPAHGSLSIPLQLQFLVGQAPYYIDGPHELQVMFVATIGARS